MIIEQRLLTPNAWSRPQNKIKEFKAIVMHWTANPNANAKQNWLYFEAKKTGMSSYGSAHYIRKNGTKQYIIFRGCDNPEKIKSIKIAQGYFGA